ncbi:MAG: RNA-binding protein [Candidatus Cloacimonetes bacterium]|nr:RNA-binding protein [Candidatus Cloacimonadota bacterium]
MKIFVGNLTRDIGKETLLDLFSDYGDVQAVNILIDKIDGEWKAFAFIDMPQEKEAWDAIAALDNKEHFGHTLIVHQARYRTKDRRGPDRQGGRRYTDLPEVT